MAKILTLDAYEQARRALRGVCEPRAFGAVVRTLYSTAKENKNRPSDDGRTIGVFAYGEDTHA